MNVELDNDDMKTLKHLLCQQKKQTVDFDVIGISSAEKYARQKNPDRNTDKSLNCGLFQDIITLFL